MPRQEYVGLNVTPEAREALHQAKLKASAEQGKQLTYSEVLIMMSEMFSYPQRWIIGDPNFDPDFIQHVENYGDDPNE